MTLESTTTVTPIHALTWATMLFASSLGGEAQDFPQACDEVRLVLQSVQETVSGEQASVPLDGVHGASNTAKLIEVWANSLIEAAQATGAPLLCLDDAKARVRELVPLTMGFNQ